MNRILPKHFDREIEKARERQQAAARHFSAFEARDDPHAWFRWLEMDEEPNPVTKRKMRGKTKD